MYLYMDKPVKTSVYKIAVGTYPNYKNFLYNVN